MITHGYNIEMCTAAKTGLEDGGGHKNSSGGGYSPSIIFDGRRGYALSPLFSSAEQRGYQAAAPNSN